MNMLLSVVIAVATLCFASTHSGGMSSQPAPNTPAVHTVDPTPTPDVCQALRDMAAKHGQHIDDCHSYQERTVG